MVSPSQQLLVQDHLCPMELNHGQGDETSLRLLVCCSAHVDHWDGNQATSMVTSCGASWGNVNRPVGAGTLCPPSLDSAASVSLGSAGALGTANASVLWHVKM